MNGIGAFIKETLESPPLLSHEDRVTRQPPVRQDGGAAADTESASAFILDFPASSREQ